MIENKKIDQIIAGLYAEIVRYNEEMERYDYDDQTRKANREELRVLGAKIEVSREIIKRLQKLVEE